MTESDRKPEEPLESGALATMDYEKTDDETDGSAHARMLADPSAHAATTIYQFHPARNGADITSLLKEVGARAAEVRNGDMSRPEDILTVQAHALDTIFNALAQKAAVNLQAGHPQAMETYLRMALKAQSQCRTTIEALAEIKYPKAPTFVKQQNVGQNIQVNNGRSGTLGDSGTHARAQEKDITPANELLEASHGKRLDAGTTGTTGGTHPDVAALEPVYRPKN